MKSLILTLAVLVGLLAPSLFVLAPQAAAVDVFPACTGNISSSSVCKDAKKAQSSSNNPIIDLISVIIGVLTYIIGVAAVLGIILSGIRFITANGDSGKVAAARSGLIYSLVGLAVAALAQTLVVFVLDKIK